MDIIRIAMLAITGCLLALQFKSRNQEYAYFVCFALGILIFVCAIDKLRNVLVQFERIQSALAGQADYLGLLLKVIGITYVCEFCSGVCKDAGFAQVAMQVEVFGKLTILLSGMPVILALLDTLMAMG